MKLGEFYSTIERNSEPGSVLAFYDKFNSRTHYLDENSTYKYSIDCKGNTLTISFFPSAKGELLYRDALLSALDNLMKYRYSPEMKCQIIMPDQNGQDPKGYLTDNMWSHMEPDGPNVFAFDNPIDVEELEKSLFRRYAEYYVECIMDGSQLDGGC